MYMLGNSAPLLQKLAAQKVTATATDGFGTQNTAAPRSPVAPPPIPSAVKPLVNLAVTSQAQTGLQTGQDARKFLEENQKEIMQIVFVSALIALGFHLLDG